ncbi:MAG: SGNH/GDSL hydrolase family protein [Microvirga sp.]
MAIDFQRLVFFGDSLTDDGNLPEPVRPDAPYVGGRFSNGPVYAEVLARELGILSDDVALGGAEASTESGDNIAQKAINLSSQVSTYLGDSPFPFSSGTDILPGTAASILIGSNDVLNEKPATGAEATDLSNRVVASISASVADLADAGVSHVVLYTLPNVTDAPRAQALSPAQRVLDDQFVAATNQGIKAIAAQFSGSIATTVVDLNRLEAEIRQDRETFGLKVLETPLYAKSGDTLVSTGITSQVSASQVAFFDPLHPTKIVHAIIGAFSEATLKADLTVLRGGGANVIAGSGGSDLVLAGGGADRVSGAAGQDVLLGGTGNDRVNGGAGNDLVSGGSGGDVVYGKAGTDVLAGNLGDDTIIGGAGSDVLIGGAGGDVILGQSGHDLFVFSGDGTGNGFDQVLGGSGIDTLRLNVSQGLFDSAGFKAELAAYASLLDARSGATYTFADLDLAVTGIERLEVRVGGKVVYTDGHAAVAQSAARAALMHDADLWGFL